MTREVGDRQQLPDGDRLLIRTTNVGSQAVVRLAGEIDFSTADLLRKEVLAAARAVSPPCVVLDLDQVWFCDSSALRALIAVFKVIRADGGRLILARPPDHLRRILSRAGLDRYFTIRDTVDEATPQSSTNGTALREDRPNRDQQF
jgi:anti-sigma B factor antagonist